MSYFFVLQDWYSNSPITILISAISICLTLIYSYYANKFTFWSSRGVDGPRPLPLLGNLLEMLFKSQFELDMKRIEQYGQIYGIYEGASPIITIADPVILKQIMVKDFHMFPDRRPIMTSNEIFKYFLTSIRGNEWRHSRSTLTPTFTSGKIKAMYPLMADCSSKLIDALASKSGQEVDLKYMYGCYTLDVIAKCCFAMDTNSFLDPNNVFLKNAVAFFKGSLWRAFALLLIPAPIRNAFGFTFIPSDVTDFFKDVTSSVIRQRKSSGNKKFNDFVQLLLEANQTNGGDGGGQVLAHEPDDQEHHLNQGVEEKMASDKQFNLASSAKKPMSEAEMIAHSILFLVAGYETTGSLLTFGTYALAMNPNVQDELAKQVKSIVDVNGNVNYEQLISNRYLDAFVCETLRMYTPAVRVERCVEDDYVLSDRITLPKGTIVQIPLYAIHHQAEFYPEPNKFDPTRFLAENKDKLVPYTYLPFGAGPRNCIGMRFALVEAKLALVQVISKFKFEQSANTAVPLNYRNSRALLQVDKAVVRVTRRE